MHNKFFTDIITRFFDIIFSGLALFVLSPILLIIMIILKFTGEGEVFYLQERIGKKGKPFKVIKFATMLKNSAEIGTKTVTTSNDPRILPFGKFLRKTKMNELPQLINIIKGDMSVIGPRPRTFKFYNALDKKYKVSISQLKPGLSGIGSVIFRDEEEILHKIDNPVEFDFNVITPYKGKLEKWYVENRSIPLYFKLIFLTIIAVLSSNVNIYNWFKDLPEPPNALKKLLTGEI